MKGRRGRKRAVRENAPDGWSPDPQIDDDEDELPEPTSRGAVQPIRDVPDAQVFRFELGPAILAQLLEKLEVLPLMPLEDALGAQYPGFYQLFVSGEPKYIGKTARPVGQRLREHARKLRHRKGIPMAEVKCRFAFVEDPSLVDVAEGALIDFFAVRGMAEWNASGFGSKVTGHGRGGQSASDWAVQYPPELDVEIEIAGAEEMPLVELFSQVKRAAPVTISIPRQHLAAFTQLHGAPLRPERRRRTFLEWIEYIESSLDPTWHLVRKAESWYVVPRN